MAKANAVWGIDIGQCALKALRCRPHDDDPQKLIVESFDYVEYPKILSQPEADPEELVNEAITQFASRNTLVGDRVAISVSGQSGLARFIKLPPVESKKIPDIVKYEARQQIPFALEDVVWDYQQMAGGSEDDGFALETEVGLFAMKRDQVYRALQPFDNAGIAVDLIQLAPLAIYNYIVFDQFDELPPVDEYDPENPPPSTLVLSIGTDTTDLVVTNGFRVWQRSIPIGGNHFTKALTKELRLTFAKAEHLKRHAKEAENAKAVFQAMRPVFSSLLTEVQRSIGFFSSLDRHAKIDRIFALGNAMKLPGLQRYLSQNLEQDVTPVTEFSHLEGASVVGNPQFKSNLLSFGTAYGLCLQGLGDASIHTNLLPDEIVTSRLIRAKKPWMVAAVAAMLLGCAINFVGHWSAFSSADVTKDEFQDAFRQVNRVSSESNNFIGNYSSAQQEREDIDKIGQNLTANVHRRLHWLELLAAVDASLPPYQAQQLPEGKSFTDRPIEEREELHIESIDCEELEDVGSWYVLHEETYKKDHGLIEATSETDSDGEYSDYSDSELEESSENGPAGPGWIVEISGFHYHNRGADRGNEGPQYVRNTLLKHLKDGDISIASSDGTDEVVPIADLGIRYPVLVDGPLSYSESIIDRDKLAEMRSENGKGNGNGDADRNDRNNLGRLGFNRTATAAPETPMIEVKRQNFVVQLCWQPTTPSERKELKDKRAEAAAQAAREQAEAEKNEESESSGE